MGSRSWVDEGPIRSITGMHPLTGARRCGRGPVLLLVAWTVAASLAVVSPKPAGAAENVPTSWTGTAGPPQPVHEPSGPCLPGCFQKEVTVDVDPSYWAGVPGALEVRLCSNVCDQPPDLADFDLHVYTGDGDLIASSAARPSNAEETVYVGRPSGTYVVRVVTAAFLTAEQLPKLPQYEVKVAVREGVKSAAQAMGLQCSKAGTWLTQEAWELAPKKPEIPYDSCSGFVKRGGHPPLYINIALPAGAMRPVPTIALLHGWTGTGGGWRAATADGCYGDPATRFCPTGSYHNNSPWFVTRGYAAISYSARGHGSSCGLDRDPTPPPEECTEGWAHIGERSAEAADTQHLLSVFVDANVADPDRLGATGGSYGGGQSWLLATSFPWLTPAGKTLQLAAAAPSHGWTSFQNSLAPNGRATDGAEQSPGDLDRPYGVVKRGFLNELLTAGRKGAGVPALCSYPAAVVCPVGFVRYNDTRPDEPHSHVAGWQAFWEAGEPYDLHGHVYTEAFRGKSAYHADHYLAELAAGTVRPVPIFAVSGWTDFLFPAVETLQMYRRLKEADPRYPIWTVLDDSGHGRPGEQSPKEHVRSANDRRTAFFDRYLGGHDTDLGPKVVSKRSSCNGGPVDLSGVSGSSWDRVRGPEITLSPLDSGKFTTTHPGRSAEIDGARGDPFGLACAQASEPSSGDASWTLSTPPQGATLLGLPTVEVDYKLTGTDATLVAKLWDVAPKDGPRTLVTRGVYRLTEADGLSEADSTTRRLSFQLFGNHWNFAAGHTVELELVQSDAPLFQADKLPSSLTLSSPSVRLPTARGS